MGQESIEGRLTSLEYNLHSITVDMEVLTKQQATLNESFNTITELLVRQARAEEQSLQTHQDTVKNTEDIKRIEKEGTSVCAIHKKENSEVIQSIERLQKSLAFRDKIMLSIVLLFASGLVTMFLKTFESVGF